jgi:23S rRNA pseudouridine1911/1915/1917 synthase
MMIARTTKAKQFLQAQLAAGAVHKTYLALVVGRIEPPAATISLPLGRDPRRPLTRAVVANGRPAQTKYQTQAVYPGYSLVEAQPVTGRTHQIRVHLAALGHPIAGDTVYGGANRPLGLHRHFLHATKLEIPTASGQVLRFECQLPPDLQDCLSQLEKSV